MAKPIIDNPVLYGKDAERIRQMVCNVKPVSKAYMKRFEQDITFIRQHANFAI